MNKTYITDQYRGNLFLARSAQQHGGVVYGIKMTSLQNLLLEEHDADEVMLLKLRRLLAADKSSFPIYGEMFSYSAFFAEVLSFARECILYGISTENLPAQDARENELQRIMACALSLNLAEKKNTASLEARLHDIKEMQGLTLIPGFTKDIYHQKILQQLVKDIPVMEQEDVEPKMFFRTADDPRRELESIVQDMLSEGQDSTIVLTDPSTQLPILKGILKRYNIAYSVASESSVSKVNAIYASLVKLAVYRDVDHLLDAMRLQAFRYNASGDTLAFALETLTEAAPTNNIKDVFEACEQFASQASGIGFKEEKLNKWFQYNEKDLALLFSSSEPWDILDHSFEVLRHSSLMKERTHLKAGMTLRSLLMEVKNEIQSIEDVLFLMQTLGEKNIPSYSLDSLFCTITDLQHPVDVNDVVYVAGCSGVSYPGFKTRSGIFDEQYTSSITKYPSINDRHHLYMHELSWLQHCARKKLYWSYPAKDFQGHEIQCAYEIETMFAKDDLQVWPLAVLQPNSKKQHHISPSAAADLYLEDDGKITGSVSTIERWFQCPYSWFLNTGLKVRKDLPVDSDAAGIGTIQHAIMETAVNMLNKDYAAISDSTVKNLITSCFDVLRAAHPHKKNLLDLSEERMFNGIKKSLNFLSDFEKHSSYIPSYTEHKFLEPITDHVNLRGTIDRVDIFSESFRIIDYKSSEHTLSATDISAGLQLQLLSYLMIATKLFDKNPAGAYYFSLKEPNVAIAAAVSSGRGKKKEVIWSDLTEKEISAAVKKSRQLKGWTFTTDTTSLDDDESHIATIAKSHDYEGVYGAIQTLYEKFYTEIADGNIALSPLENACTFCDYKTICRFRGEYRKKPKFVDMKGI